MMPIKAFRGIALKSLGLGGVCLEPVFPNWYDPPLLVDTLNAPTWTFINLLNDSFIRYTPFAV